MARQNQHFNPSSPDEAHANKRARQVPQLNYFYLSLATWLCLNLQLWLHGPGWALIIITSLRPNYFLVYIYTYMVLFVIYIYTCGSVPAGLDLNGDSRSHLNKDKKSALRFFYVSFFFSFCCAHQQRHVWIQTRGWQQQVMLSEHSLLLRGVDSKSTHWIKCVHTTAQEPQH